MCVIICVIITFEWNSLWFWRSNFEENLLKYSNLMLFSNANMSNLYIFISDYKEEKLSTTCGIVMVNFLQDEFSCPSWTGLLMLIMIAHNVKRLQWINLWNRQAQKTKRSCGVHGGIYKESVIISCYTISNQHLSLLPRNLKAVLNRKRPLFLFIR